MDNCLPKENSAVPEEYRKIAKALFPPEAMLPPGEKPPAPGLAAVAGFAQALGVGNEYQRLLAVKNGMADIQEFLGHFQNNLNLLIQKTWVEKADIDRKETLQDEIPPFVALIEQGHYGRAVETFSAILKELAYLLFGEDSALDDFTEYAFRMDRQMGLFWWYSSQLGRLKETDANDEILRAVLLIGISYLTNF
jgi:hypothetical protein